MSREPETVVLRRLVLALDAVLVGADDAAQVMGKLPATTDAFSRMTAVEKTGARALLKAVEQAQDIIARVFRTYLIVEQIDIEGMTARDIANRAEKYGLLADADQWSDLVKLRNRLAHEYPVGPAAQLDRVASAMAAVPQLKAIRDGLLPHFRQKGFAA